MGLYFKLYIFLINEVLFSSAKTVINCVFYNVNFLLPRKFINPLFIAKDNIII